MKINPKNLAITTLILVMLAEPCLGSDEINEADIRVKNDLEELANGKGNLQPLTVTYDDYDPFHGGLTLTIHGNGSVEQRFLRYDVGKTRTITAKELESLVDLLRKNRAWEQQTPERPAIPDESRAKLIISYGKDSVMIWEWFNDMGKNQRISEISGFMKKIAWTK